MFYFDATMLILLPGILLAAWAQFKISSTFRRYSEVRSRIGITGAELARRLLGAAQIAGVQVVAVEGELTDNYNPETNTLSLSQGVYGSTSVAALGVAAHECGHVMQQHTGYAPLGLRSVIVPTVQIGSSLSWPIFLVGLIFSWRPLMLAGIVLFSLAVVFTLVALPVEFNASGRALRALEGEGVLEGEELRGAKAVLSAAAMTYVASALSAILQLLRLLMLAGNSRRRD